MAPLNFGYYLTAARRAGVPLQDLEDAAQDIAIKVWQADTPYWRRVVQRAAVDAARKYGPRTRKGKLKPQPVSLDALREVGWDRAAEVHEHHEGRWYVCRVCGTGGYRLSDVGAPRRFCSDLCKHRSSRGRLALDYMKTCAACGKEYVAAQYTSRYCSLRCQDRIKKRKKRARQKLRRLCGARPGVAIP